MTDRAEDSYQPGDRVLYQDSMFAIDANVLDNLSNEREIAYRLAFVSSARGGMPEGVSRMGDSFSCVKSRRGMNSGMMGWKVSPQVYAGLD